MRRIAEFLHKSLLVNKFPDVMTRMNWVERYEALRMVDETKKYKAGQDTNDLLEEVLKWFGESFEDTDKEVLTRAAKVRDFVTTYVRQPELYKREYERARDQWDIFIGRTYPEPEEPEEPNESDESSSDRDEDREDRSSEYNDEDGDPMDVDSAQGPEAEDQGPEENSGETPEQPPTSAYRGEAFANLRDKDPEHKPDYRLDNALVSRLKTSRTGVENHAGEDCALTFITNHPHMGSARSEMEAFNSNHLREKALVEEDTKSEFIGGKENSSNDILQEGARKYVIKGIADRVEQTTTTIKHEHDDPMLNSLGADPDSEAETDIADARERGMRKTMEDNSEAEDSDSSSSSDAQSIVRHLPH